MLAISLNGKCKFKLVTVNDNIDAYFVFKSSAFNNLSELTWGTEIVCAFFVSFIIALENAMYQTIRSGLAKFDVSLPEELQSYVSYLLNELAKLGLRRQAT